MRNLLAIVASAAILVWTGTAQAKLMGCETDVDSGNFAVENTAECQLGSTNNDKLKSPLQVNHDVMFGYDDWVFAQKDEDLLSNGLGAGGIGLDVSGPNETSGSWIIDDIWSEVDHVMLVFKGGNGRRIEPGEYVGFLLSDGALSGAYMSPFSKNGNLTGISHVSAYIRGVTVPEPGPLALLGLGLALMGWVHRKKRV